MTRPKQIGILGATITGNHGAEAMLSTLIQEIEARLTQKPHFHVFSYYPKDDQAEQLAENITIHSATPLKVVTQYLWMFLSPFRSRNAFSSLDILLDVAGVSFIDQRLKFLPYNILTLLPFIRNKVPVVKCPQAMGPFRHPINRFFARSILNRCSGIFSRGNGTSRYLKELGLKQPFSQCPDLAFLLHPDQQTVSTPPSPKIGIAVSSLLHKKHPDYFDKMAALAQRLIGQGFDVELLCHSWRANSTGTRNNDPVCAQAINSKLETEVPIVGMGMNAAELKRHIGSYAFLITSRFHALIAGLSMSVPSFVIGWSHKYEEVLGDFELSHMSCMASGWDPQAITDQVMKHFSDRAQIAKQITEQLPAIRDKAQAPINHILRILNDD